MIDVAIELLCHLLQRTDLYREVVTAGRRFLQHPDAQSERRELLAELIVHLARDAPPFVFLRKHHPAEQLGARALAALALARLFGLLAFGQVEMRADDTHD